MATSLLTRVKARVDLHTSNRARGLIQGRGRSMFKGSGEDFDDLKYYQPGDKISDIDWKATARSGEPLIRQFNEERVRSEEHTSELQSRGHLVCRLLLEKKKIKHSKKLVV